MKGLGILAGGLVAGLVLGYLAHRNEWLPASLRVQARELFHVASRPAVSSADELTVPPGGDWYPFNPPESTADDQDMAEVIGSLGYMQAFSKAPAQHDVTVYDPDSAFDGYNLYNSGHAPEAVLTDMHGVVIHRWSFDFNRLWPDFSPPPYQRVTGHLNWRRVHLFSNGDLLALHSDIGLIKLDKDSNLLWSYRGGNHHDFWITPEGEIYTLTRELRVVSSINPDAEILDPYFSVLSAEGKFLRTTSLLKSFENSVYSPLLARITHPIDVFHANTIEVFDGSHANTSPYFKKGNVLVSIHQLDAIAIVDPEREEVVWALTGMWRGQHESTLLDNGHMMIFDNFGRTGRSRVLEFDPFTQAVAWSYGQTDGQAFYSQFCGAVQRMPNGNTLITETKNGRAFEVTPEGHTVWEYVNPHRLDQDGVTMIAALFEVQRIFKADCDSWLKDSEHSN